ncbi:isopenicillin N synthase family oxygenase, partial [Rhodococcus hoagii]|nr:isopenicillin N synthase family oxygenase [Prescottella equi]
MPAQSLPIIDLENLDIDALRKVTHEIGFFYLTGHGIDQQLTD